MRSLGGEIMLRRFYRCHSAAVAVEYSLLIGLIGLAVAGAAWVLGDSIAAAFASVVALF